MGRYKVYPEFKESGIEWVGNIPSHWTLARLKNVLKIRNGKDYKEVEVSSGGYPVYGSGGIFKYSSTFLYDGESVLFGRKGTIDKPLLVKGKFWTVDTMFYSEVCSSMDARFIHNQAMLFPYDLLSTNTALPSMTQEDLLELGFVFPDYEEQKKIANFLDHETSKIDTLISKQEKLIELLQEKRQAVISHAVTKGLNPDVRMKDSGVEWLGDVPEHWMVLPTKRFFRLVAEPSSKNHDKELLSVYTAIGVAPRKELEQKGNKASNTDGYWLVKKGDIIVNKLLAWMGAVGYSDYNGVTSPAYDILRKTKDINPKFYHYLFRQEFTQKEFKRWSRGIMEMRLRLYFEELGRIMMPMPPKNEQDVIVAKIESMDKTYSQIEGKCKLQIDLLKERKTALISAAVTGKIDVRDWQNG
ncbi:restriction endonuclease subunit S [Providencia vermicola]|uniref:restriction endonuclease subunit S n=1 Tax=Providencia vermicola TaxID=333965 RepID=UPI003D81871D